MLVGPEAPLRLLRAQRQLDDVSQQVGPNGRCDELRYLVDRYGVRRACAADNILDHRYFNTFLPRLIEARLGLKFVYELKTNLTRKQVQTLLAAGLGAAQLGVEP